jgi:hypothetical protein
MASQDDAQKRKQAGIKADAAKLPPPIKHLRDNYPDKLSTSEIAEALGMSKSAVLSELNNSRRVNRHVGTAHGSLDAAEWQYKPTGPETPWSPEYK